MRLLLGTLQIVLTAPNTFKVGPTAELRLCHPNCDVPEIAAAAAEDGGEGAGSGGGGGAVVAGVVVAVAAILVSLSVHWRWG